MMFNMCLNRCREFGYVVVGFEYGEECYCGDFFNIVVVGVIFCLEIECVIICVGNVLVICGGFGCLIIYFWIGIFFYSWGFFQDYCVGQYQYLVNGVNCLFIIQEIIIGKVFFIFKGGIGFGNEIGVYEFDM